MKVRHSRKRAERWEEGAVEKREKPTGRVDIKKKERSESWEIESRVNICLRL